MAGVGRGLLAGSLAALEAYVIVTAALWPTPQHGPGRWTGRMPASPTPATGCHHSSPTHLPFSPPSPPGLGPAPRPGPYPPADPAGRIRISQEPILSRKPPEVLVNHGYLLPVQIRLGYGISRKQKRYNRLWTRMECEHVFGMS